MINQFKKILSSSMFVLILLIISACSDDKNTGSGNDGTGGENPTIPSGSLDYYLGADFSIKSLDNEKFTSKLSEPLIYTVEEINPDNKNNEEIKTDLENAIKTKLEDTYNVVLGTTSADARIGSDDTLIITIPVTITEKVNTLNTGKGVYVFVIKFMTTEVSLPDFYLGTDFTIKSLDNINFTSRVSTPFIYTVDEINSESKDNKTIETELKSGIKAKLGTANNIVFGTTSSTGSVMPNNTLVVTINATITDKVNSNKTGKGSYVFVIKFITKDTSLPDFYLGIGFSIASLDNKTFTSKASAQFIYTVDEINPETKSSGTIVTELKNAIKVKLGTANNIVFDTISTTGSVAFDDTLVVTIEATVTDKLDGNKTGKGAYVFIIKFVTTEVSLPDFYLGADFTIESLDNKTFTSTISTPFTYTVAEINSESKNSGTIATELENAIEAKLGDTNTVDIGTTSTTGSVTPGDTLVVTIEATVTDKLDGNKTGKGAYVFIIKFVTKDISLPDFYLGTGFSIASLDNKTFTSKASAQFIYTIDEINPETKNISTIETELKNAIEAKLGTINNIVFSTISSTGSVAFDDTLVVTIEATLTDKSDDKKTGKGAYVFIIKFITTQVSLPDFYLGEYFTIASLDNKTFTSEISTPLIYTIAEINSESKNSGTIVTELESAIKTKLGSSNNIVFGTTSSTGSVTSGDTLVVTIEATVTDKLDGNKTGKAGYVFIIKFMTKDISLPDFYLGTGFSIASLGSAEFTGTIATPFIYTVAGIDPETVNSGAIESDLKAVITTKLGTANNIVFGTISSTGSVAFDDTLVVTIEATLTDNNDDKKTGKGAYVFIIKFITIQVSLPDFYLGADFTIESLDNITFTSTASAEFIYTVDEVNPETAISGTIVTELKNAIEAKLGTINNIVFGTTSTTGSVASEDTLVVTIEATVTDKLDGNKTGKGAYVFIIKFMTLPTIPNNSPVYYLGEDFAIASLDNAQFSSTLSVPLKYNVTNLNSESKESALIINELQSAILANLKTDYHVVLEQATTTGSITPNATFVVTIVATIKGRINECMTGKGAYVFSIKFREGIPIWGGVDDILAITPTVDGIYNIKFPSNLAWIAQQSIEANNTFDNKTVRFMNDINMNNHNFAGIKLFKGRLEGNHKKIHNLNMHNDIVSTISNVGLINTLDGGSIDNLTIESGGIRGSNQVGAFVGEVAVGSTGKILGVKNNAKVRGGKSVGGIVGAVNAGSTLTIDNSSNFGDVTGSVIGGFVGYVDGTLHLTDVHNRSAIVRGVLDYSGGLVGFGDTESTISVRNSSNTSDVSGGSGVGGLVGSGYETVPVGLSLSITIDNSSNTGNVSGNSDTGGLVGAGGKTLTISNSSNSGKIDGGNSTGSSDTGGLVGASSGTSIINNSSNIGNIKGFLYVGGLVGRGYGSSVTINDSSNSGSVKGHPTDNKGKYLGGIIGNASSVTILTNVHSYAKSVTSASPSLGGIAGNIDFGNTLTANNVYWLYDSAVPAEEGGIESGVGYGDDRFTNTGSKSKALTIALFKTQESFNAWDFESVWQIITNSLYPTLKIQPVVRDTP